MCISDWSSDVCSSDLIRIADDAAGLVESDLEFNLNEPNKLGDVNWFKPMKYIGIWWGMIRGDWSWAEGPKHGATTERTKQYIDFAAKHGFGGVLVEGWNKGWNGNRSEEHTSELQSLMRLSYAVFCLKKNNTTTTTK